MNECKPAILILKPHPVPTCKHITLNGRYYMSTCHITGSLLQSLKYEVVKAMHFKTSEPTVLFPPHTVYGI